MDTLLTSEYLIVCKWLHKSVLITAAISEIILHTRKK